SFSEEREPPLSIIFAKPKSKRAKVIPANRLGFFISLPDDLYALDFFLTMVSVSRSRSITSSPISKMISTFFFSLFTLISTVSRSAMVRFGLFFSWAEAVTVIIPHKRLSSIFFIEYFIEKSLFLIILFYRVLLVRLGFTTNG